MKIAQSGHVTSELTQKSRLRRAHTWGLKFYGCHPEILDNCVMGMVFCIGGPLGQGSLCQGFRVLAHTQSCHCPQMRLGTLLPCPLPPQGLQASPAHSCWLTTAALGANMQRSGIRCSHPTVSQPPAPWASSIPRSLVADSVGMSLLLTPILQSRYLVCLGAENAVHWQVPCPLWVGTVGLREGERPVSTSPSGLKRTDMLAQELERDRTQQLVGCVR